MNHREPPHADPAYREARRAAARAHHPDAGGDAESLIQALLDIDARFGAGSATRPSPRPTIVTSRRRQIARRLTAARKMLPARRKYVDLPRTVT